MHFIESIFWKHFEVVPVIMQGIISGGSLSGCAGTASMGSIRLQGCSQPGDTTTTRKPKTLEISLGPIGNVIK
jgi:hypothetical protein